MLKTLRHHLAPLHVPSSRTPTSTSHPRAPSDIFLSTSLDETLRSTERTGTNSRECQSEPQSTLRKLSHLVVSSLRLDTFADIIYSHVVVLKAFTLRFTQSSLTSPILVMFTVAMSLKSTWASLKDLGNLFVSSISCSVVFTL